MLKQIFNHKSKILFVILFIWFIVVDINQMNKGKSFFFKYDFPHNLFIYTGGLKSFEISSDWGDYESDMFYKNRHSFSLYDKKLTNIYIRGFKYDKDSIYLIGVDKEFGKYYCIIDKFEYMDSTKKYHLGTKIFSENDFKTTKYYSIFNNLELYSTTCECGVIHNHLMYSAVGRFLSIYSMYIFISLFIYKNFYSFKQRIFYSNKLKTDTSLNKNNNIKWIHIIVVMFIPWIMLLLVQVVHSIYISI